MWGVKIPGFFVWKYVDRYSSVCYNVIEVVMSLSKLSSDLLRGNTDTIILRVLAGGDSYGYQIVKCVNELSEFKYELKQATMYSSVRRLELSGDIVWYWGDESLGGRRKYFKITDKGLNTLAENQRNWCEAKLILDSLMFGEENNEK